MSVQGTITGEPAISCRGLRREFPGGVALDGLDLDVPRGTVLALLGPNGAGKTTTIRLLNGILSPHGGTATVLGLDPTVDGDELRRRTGVLTENAGLDDRLTAHENLTATARMRGIRGAAARTRADELLELFGMSEHARQRCQGFSTGQRRRVALARALLHDPEMLFLDEPTSGLDPISAGDFDELIRTLQQTLGLTVFMVTHDLESLYTACDRVAVIADGKVVAEGPIAAMLQSTHPWVRTYFQGNRGELLIDRRLSVSP
jgi:ABC-type multidrug transport system ATPase subunit